MAGLGVIHGIAGELGAIKNYHHGEVCGRLLLPFLELLNKTENPEQQALMADLAAALFPVHALSPAKMLAEWLKDRAIAPFWQDAPPLTVSEIDWILARSNSKNSLVTYSKAQQRFMLESAFSVQ